MSGQANPWPRRVVLLLVIVATAVWWFTQPPGGSTDAPAKQEQKQQPAESGLRTVVDDAVVRSYGKVVHRGRVDLAKTIARIKAGKKHRHRNDGSVFRNREGRLPKHKRGYYREYVHPTKGIKGAGPQRLVVGSGGEWYYTPDHYESFIPLHDQGARPPP